MPDDDDLTCELELPDPLELASIDPPLPWLAGDQRILNPAIRVGTPLDKLLVERPGLLMILANNFRWGVGGGCVWVCVKGVGRRGRMRGLRGC